MPAQFHLSGRQSPSKYIIRGNFIDAPSSDSIRVRNDAEIVVDCHTGRIERIVIGREQWTDEKAKENGGQEVKLVYVPEGSVVVPGFIDCHVHAPQYRQLGTKTDLPLMEWLNKYTFPTEFAFCMENHATEVYTALVRRMLLNGTTTALYFGSDHLEATQILASLCAEHGQRALVGKCCSDQLLPGLFTENAHVAVTRTEMFIEWCLEKWGQDGLVVPVITPRFIPTCSKTLLEGLGKLALKYPHVHIQTHAAEAVDQMALVREQWPQLQRDIAVLKHTNLLRDKTVLAHCCHLTDSEAKEVAEVKASIASCPYSNMLFAGKVLPLPRFRRFGVRIGLGTDIAGGHSSWMGSAVRQAILADRVAGWETAGQAAPPDKEEEEGVDWKYAFHLATRGGALALGLQDVGVFGVGMKWDAVQLDLAWKDEEEDINLTVEDRFERWTISHGGPESVRHVWVDGVEVVTRT